MKSTGDQGACTHPGGHPPGILRRSCSTHSLPVPLFPPGAWSLTPLIPHFPPLQLCLHFPPTSLHPCSALCSADSAQLPLGCYGGAPDYWLHCGSYPGAPQDPATSRHSALGSYPLGVQEQSVLLPVLGLPCTPRPRGLRPFRPAWPPKFCSAAGTRRVWATAALH